MVHFYGIAPRELLATPIRVFWTLNANIPRISAEKDLRTLNVMITAAHGDKDGVERFQSALREQIGEVERVESRLDKSGWARLKQLAGGVL